MSKMSLNNMIIFYCKKNEYSFFPIKEGKKANKDILEVFIFDIFKVIIYKLGKPNLRCLCLCLCLGVII